MKFKKQIDIICTFSPFCRTWPIWSPKYIHMINLLASLVIFVKVKARPSTFMLGNGSTKLIWYDAVMIITEAQSTFKDYIFSKLATFGSIIYLAHNAWNTEIQFLQEGEKVQIMSKKNLELFCDQTVWFFQDFSTVLKSFCPVESKNSFILVLAHLFVEQFSPF